MVHLDPLADQLGERMKLADIRRCPLIGRICEQTPDTLRELPSVIAAIEKGEPGGAGERRDCLAREGSERCPSYQRRELGHQFGGSFAGSESPLDPIEFVNCFATISVGVA